MNIENKKTYGFQSEVKELLHLMINSLYSNKEIFLRELISNASDAADKLRFLAISNPDLYEKDNKLLVRISCSKKNRTIIINDNGIGMNNKEVIDNLGTIAKSGTKDFIKSIKKDISKKEQLIGQFGVGFYSAFIIAKKIKVRTRAAGDKINKGTLWESNGEGTYTISNIIKNKRGTEITLYLKENEDEFLNNWRIQNIIKKYSDHITLPIEIKEEKKNKEDKVLTWKKINKAKALWTKNKIEITKKEYKEFYKNNFQDVNDPIIWSHNHIEGQQEYISLFYIPKKAAWDIWNREYKSGLKLYVKRVFIMDNAEQLIPKYLRFIRGLIDSNDLPLNISREILQDNNIAQNLKKNISKKILNILTKLAKEDKEKYQSFWKEFGLILKEGPSEDQNNSETITKLLRFTTNYTENELQNVSLEDYVKRMIKNQDKIYYITADNYTTAKNSPHLELLHKKGIEVLLLSDRIDEWMISYIPKFKGKSFQSISKKDPELEKLIKKNNKKQEKNEEKLKTFIERIKNYLGERIKEVKITNRLINTPSVVTTDINDMSTQMVKIFNAAGQSAPEIKYIFELNPEHKIIKNITLIEKDELFNEWIELLLEQALLAERGNLEDPNKFIKRINKLLSKKIN